MAAVVARPGASAIRPARPRAISRWDNSPPYMGFTHTVLPLFDRGLLVVTDESIRDNAEDWPKLVWILDGRDESNPVPISTCPMPQRTAEFCPRSSRRSSPAPG